MSKKLAAGIIFFSFFFSTIGYTMSFFTKQVLFSEVKGVVLNQGKPVTDAEVIRRYSYDDDWKEEVIKTNKDGGFYFPKATSTSLFDMGFLPSEIVVSQEIIIKYKDTSYDAWVFVRDNYDDGSELGIKSINLICDISNEPKQIKSKTGGVVYGICQIN